VADFFGANLRFQPDFRSPSPQNGHFLRVFHRKMRKTRIKSGFRASQPLAPCCTMAAIELSILDSQFKEDVWQQA
jgi:hypothetical protein